MFWNVGYSHLSWHPSYLREGVIILCPLAKARMLTIGCLSSHAGYAYVRGWKTLWIYSTSAQAACIKPSILWIPESVFSGFLESQGQLVQCLGFEGWQSVMQERIRTNVLIPGLVRLPSGSPPRWEYRVQSDGWGSLHILWLRYATSCCLCDVWAIVMREWPASHALQARPEDDTLSIIPFYSRSTSSTLLLLLFQLSKAPFPLNP